MRKLILAAFSAAVFVGPLVARPVCAQESAPGAVSPTNQDADNRPNLSSMQSIGEAPGGAAPPGLNAQPSVRTPPSAAARPVNSLDLTSSAGGAPPRSLVARQQARNCDLQASALQGVSGPQRDAYLKTCMADSNATATLPGANATRAAPAGATGVCKDGSYTAATRSADACTGHGGLSHWI